MGYTVSFDASTKLKVGNEHGLDRHIFRDLYERGHKPLKHKNTNIRPERTKDNISLVYNHETGKLERAESFEQVSDAIDYRIGQHEGNLRKNGVAVRDLVLQLDPQWYRDRDPKKWKYSYRALLLWAVETFGRENIVAASVHLDEGHGEDRNPHIHVVFIPMDDDGKLRQTKWINGAKSLAELHTSLRKYLRKHKYDVSLERKKGTGKLVRRRSEEELRIIREAQEDVQDDKDAAESNLEFAHRRFKDAKEAKSQALEELAKAKADRQKAADELKSAQARNASLAVREREVARREQSAPPAHSTLLETVIAFLTVLEGICQSSVLRKAIQLICDWLDKSGESLPLQQISKGVDGVLADRLSQRQDEVSSALSITSEAVAIMGDSEPEEDDSLGL